MQCTSGPYTCESCGECFELANAIACHRAFVCTSPPKRHKSPPRVLAPSKQHKRTCKSVESADVPPATVFALPATASTASSFEGLLSPPPPPPDSKLPAAGSSWAANGDAASATSEPEALTLILGLYKSANPVVDAVLRSAAGRTSPAAPINPLAAASMVPGVHIENWCARCGTVFRMTGDLVHHIRGHHRQDAIAAGELPPPADELSPPPPKQPSRREQMQPLIGSASRQEKLRCSICGERFRERHHLSRHLSSH